MNIRIAKVFRAVGMGILLLAIPAAAQEIHAIGLGHLGGGYGSAHAVNNKGQIVGESLDRSYKTRAFLVNPRDTDGDGKPDLWFEDANGDGLNDLMINLTSLESDAYEWRALKINEAGQALIERLERIAGLPCAYFVITPEDANGDGIPDSWYRDNGHDGNALSRPIEPLAGSYATAVVMNNLGQVVGASSTADGSVHALLWTASMGTMDLGTIARGYAAYAVDVNDRGQVAGWCELTAGGSPRAFRITPRDRNGDGTPDQWFDDSNGDGSNDLMTELTVTGLIECEAWDINANGEVAGTGWDASEDYRLVLWDAIGQGRILGGMAGDWGDAVKVNDHGQVMGYGEDGPPLYDIYPLYWDEETGFLPLDRPMDRDSMAWDINDSGQVICSNDFYYLPFRFDPGRFTLYSGAYAWSKTAGRIDLIGLWDQADAAFAEDINDNGLIVGTGYWKSSACFWILTNTAIGSDIPVTPVDPGSGESPVTLVFDEIIEAGETTLTISPTGIPSPNGFKIGNPPQYYVIETTAVYSGPITICIDFSNIQYGGDENDLKIFHDSGSGWQQLETTIDPDTHLACAEVASLSEFALFELDVEADGLLPPLAALVPEGWTPPLPKSSFNPGRTLPLKLRLLSDGRLLTPSDVDPPKIVGLAKDAAAIPLTTLDLDSSAANDNGVMFRYADGLWVYNLGTKGWSAGTYTITLLLPDGDLVGAGFVLR
jgi:probable HAF family extracellular repeat protein